MSEVIDLLIIYNKENFVLQKEQKFTVNLVWKIQVID